MKYEKNFYGRSFRWPLLLAALFFATGARAGTISELVQQIERTRQPVLKTRRLEELGKMTPVTQEEVRSLLSLIPKLENEPREKVINVIGVVDDPRFAALFLKELDNPHPMVRAVAAGMCGKLKVAEAEPKLCSIIGASAPVKDFPDRDEERLLVTAVLALGELGRQSSIDVLISQLGKVKRYEVQALRKFGVRALPALIEKINEPDLASEVNLAATQTLLAINDPAAVPLLEKEVDNLKSRVRAYAITLLLKISPAKYLDSFLARWKEAPDAVLEARLLYYISNRREVDDKVTSFLIAVLEKSDNTSYRVMAVTSLARLKNEEAYKALDKAALDKDKKVSLYAAQAVRMRRAAAAQNNKDKM